jgi:hypothetical protein
MVLAFEIGEEMSSTISADDYSWLFKQPRVAAKS